MKKIFYALVCLLLLSLSSCKKATYLRVNPEKVEINMEGGQQVVHVTTDGSWDVVGKPEWVTFTQTDDELIVDLEKNPTTKRRIDVIVLAAGDHSFNLPVTQFGEATYIKPSQSSLEFSKEGGTQTVGVDADGAVEVTCDGPFDVNLANSVLTVSASENTEGLKQGVITLKSGDITASLSVKQNGKVCSRCGGRGKIRCPYCHGTGWDDSGPAAGGYCWHCGGYGGSDMYGRYGSGRIKCPSCHGTGQAR